MSAYPKLEARLRDPTANDKHVTGLSERWKPLAVETGKETGPADYSTSEFQQVMAEVPGYEGQAKSFTHIYDKAKQEDGDTAFFNTWYSPASGLIYSYFNRRSQRPQQARPVADHWSDVIFWRWTETCTTAQIDPNQLRWVFQYKVTNKETQDIAYQLTGKSPVRNSIHWFSINDSDPSGFFALSMTPNVAGTFWMTYDYPRSLQSYVARIGLASSTGELNTVIQLDRYTGAPLTPSISIGDTGVCSPHYIRL